ncbi:hypothetical protein LSAT2_032786 [Lamellibrachia satsuma]|nr:hypothetical protein LSAT2_032786 [Lamellibrachia satsuma]
MQLKRRLASRRRRCGQGLSVSSSITRARRQRLTMFAEPRRCQTETRRRQRDELESKGISACGNTNCEISAFDGDYTPQLVTDTLKTGSLERLDVHSCETDNWSLNHLVTDAHKTGSYDSLDVHSYETNNLNFDHLETDTHKTGFIDPLDVHSCEPDNLNLDHLSLHVGRSGGQGKSTCVRSKEEDEKCSCPSEGFLGATCVDVTEVAPDYNTSDSCRESPTGNAMMLSSPQVNCAEMTYTGSSSEGSICDGLTYSAEYAADNDVACAIAVSAITSCSPESTNSTESLFDSLTEYDGAMISDNATDTTPCPAVAPRCSTGAESGSRADSIAENVCSPRSVGSSSGAVSCIESRFSTETEHCTSPMIICRNNMGNVVKRRPTSLQVTPVYVHKGLPTVEDSVPSELEPEDTSRQRHEMNKTSPVLRVSHCDDRSSTSGSQTCRANTNRYSWPASQSVQLRSRSCSRLRRKHVKSAIMTSTADSLGTVGLSRRFHSQQLPLTKSASFGHSLFQNVHWECPMTSARQVDSRKSEKFIMSLQKDGVIKPRLQQRCRHKRHSYHVTTGPCVTCTNHTNSLGPCFVLGIGQCHLCSDSSRNIAIKKNNDHPLVELEYVVPKSKNKTREAKTKAVEPMDMAVRNEMLQYTREKLGQRSKEDLVVLVEHFSRQARVVSEELVRLLQQKHDYIEQIEMRKVAIEQLLRLQMETK